MNTTLQNSIWPNAGGTLGEIKTQIPDGVTVKWPDGDALVNDFVYKDGKLVGFVDTKALILNDSKSTTFNYDYVTITLDSILEDTMTIVAGERCKRLSIKYANIIKFLTPKLKNLLGETKFELYFEKDIKKLIIHTDRITEDVLTSLETLLGEILPQTVETEKYNHNIEINWRDLNKYASCTNRQDVEAVNPDYRNDLTSEGEWVYPMPNMVSITQDPPPWFFSGSPMTEVDIELPKLTEARYVFRNATKLKKARVSIPLLTDNQRSFFEDCPLEELYVYAPRITNLEAFIIRAKFPEITEDMIVHGNITNLSYFGGVCPNLWRVALNLDYVTTIIYSFRSCPKLSSFECDLPSLIEGDAAFANAILNKESALRILNTIPTYSSGTHRLGLGIHIDHQNDEEILAAIANAEAKGWTMTVQWNGTPTSGITLMSLEEIYCKIVESEHGEYTDVNGNRHMLDWGHYVTDTAGYKEFTSIEEAVAHFNIKPIERN